MYLAYLVAPLAGWLAAGSLKFLINSLKSRRLAWELIGYGGMPSTHSAIVGTTAFLVGMRGGWDTPAFSVAATVAFVVVIDALSLRRQIGAHAAAINMLRKDQPDQALLRERMGHRGAEVLAGLATGAIVAALLTWGW